MDADFTALNVKTALREALRRLSGMSVRRMLARRRSRLLEIGVYREPHPDRRGIVRHF